MATVIEALEIALAHHQAGRLEAAEEICRQVVAIEPKNFDALYLLSVIAYRLGNQGVAFESITRALELRPDDEEACRNLGIVFESQGKLEEAVKCYRRAVAINPNSVETYDSLGNALIGQGKLEEAIGCFRRAIELHPDYAKGYCGLGIALHELRQFDEAIICHRRALELKPDYAEAYNGLGNVLQELGRLDEAVQCRGRALELKPDYAEAHSNLGDTLEKLGKLDEAVACCRRALELNPDFAEAHNHLGIALRGQGKDNEAGASFSQAIKLKPDLAQAHTNLSQILLLQGDFERGFTEYEWRWKTGELSPRNLRQPEWKGEPLAGKTILLFTEQGLGDTIQFVRYAAIIKSLGGTVVVACPTPMLKLLASCPEIDQLIGAGDEIPKHDVHASLMSLPRILKTSLSTIPANVPYLFADAALVAFWRDKLKQLSGFRIGINWCGREGNILAAKRDIPLDCFRSLAQLPGVRLVSLQKGKRRNDLAEASNRGTIVDPGEDLDQTNGPFMDTAAVMTNLDLVITSDTSVSHLAGALGVPVWTVLPFAADWRWLLDRDDSPWYPTMRLFRQKRLEDWAGVFEELRTVLYQTIADKS